MDCPEAKRGKVEVACPPDDMDCPEAKRGKVEVACPPDDSLVEVFSRLHAKPLFRFKCFSKAWCDLIADRLRCRKFPQTLEGFFTGEAVGSYGGFINLSDSERPVPLVDPSFSFLTKLPEISKIVLLDSCNGLVLFGHKLFSHTDSYDSLGYIVCNPATEEWVSVPSSGYTPWKWDDSDSDDEGNHDGPDTAAYLIFDPAISPHFQLIELKWQLMDVKNVHTFSSVTGAWRLDVVPGLGPELTMFGFSTRAFAGCPFNGMLHVCAHQCLCLLPEEDQNVILAIGGERRPTLHWPRKDPGPLVFIGQSQGHLKGERRPTLHWPRKDRGLLVFIGQSQGHLHCLSGFKIEISQMTELSIWVLEDYNAGKWVLRDNVSFSQLFGRMSGRCHVDWNVLAIHQDCGLVFFAEYWNRKLISYDMDKKEVRALCILHGYRDPIIPYVPYFAQPAVLAKMH